MSETLNEGGTTAGAANGHVTPAAQEVPVGFRKAEVRMTLRVAATALKDRGWVDVEEQKNSIRVSGSLVCGMTPSEARALAAALYRLARRVETRKIQ